MIMKMCVGAHATSDTLSVILGTVHTRSGLYIWKLYSLQPKRTL